MDVSVQSRGLQSSSDPSFKDGHISAWHTAILLSDTWRYVPSKLTHPTVIRDVRQGERYQGCVYILNAQAVSTTSGFEKVKRVGGEYLVVSPTKGFISNILVKLLGREIRSWIFRSRFPPYTFVKDYLFG